MLDQGAVLVGLAEAARVRDLLAEGLAGLGATMVNDLRNGNSGWAVLADPEGNEFCVLSMRADEAGISQR